MFDLSDHALTTISAWAEVAILVFMLWEAYGSKLGFGPMIAQVRPPNGILGLIQGNRTLIFAIVGLAIVIWLHFIRSPEAVVIHDATTPEAIASIKAELETAKRETLSLQEQLAKPKEQIASPPRYEQFFWTTCAINLLSVGRSFWERSPKGTALLITASPDNAVFMKNLSATFAIDVKSMFGGGPSNVGTLLSGGPNYEVELDAPRITKSDQRGITIHGDDPGDTLRISYGNNFVVRHTSKVPDGLAEYYKVPSVVWIDIGPGDPWTNSCGP